jgi:pyruvate, water dikinase
MVEVIRRFDDITLDDLPIVGGENAALGELFRELRVQGIGVPDDVERERLAKSA